MDPHLLRRSFTTSLQLTTYSPTKSSIDLHPSAWFDRPSGQVATDGWTRAVPFRSIPAVLMPLFGAMVSLSYLGAAGFNTRRALFGRTRKPKGRRSASASPPAPDAAVNAAAPFFACTAFSAEASTASSFTSILASTLETAEQGRTSSSCPGMGS